jgi:hypothetical protein
MAELDQLTVATKRYIRETPALVDNVFNRDPLLAYAKLNVREDFTGGRLIGEDFIYDSLIGGFYQKGKEFDVTEKQVEQQAQFQMKFAESGVTLSKEDVQVLNKGPEASFRLIESRMTNAYMTIGAHMAIALYLNGVRAGFSAFYNGIAEALNDNVTVSWDNNTYSTYGGITRGGAVGNALNSAPTNVGTIEYNTLEETYGDASFGDAEFEPNLGTTTVKGYSYIKEKFQTQQRFNDTQDPRIGFNGLKFNNATLIKSRYVPGSDIVTSGTDSNKIAVSMLKETSGGVITAYPPLAVASSETLLWLNCRKPFFFFYLSNDPEFGLGFTGFKPGQGNTKIVGQVLAASAITFPGPRYHRQIHGFTG